MTFTIFVGKKIVGHIEAKNLDEAEKKANKQYPDWTDIYIGEANGN